MFIHVYSKNPQPNNNQLRVNPMKKLLSFYVIGKKVVF